MSKYPELIPVLEVVVQRGSNVDIVLCAVVRELKDAIDVKPLDYRYNPSSFRGADAFHMAWWRLAKDSKEYEATMLVFDTKQLHHLCLKELEDMLEDGHSKAPELIMRGGTEVINRPIH